MLVAWNDDEKHCLVFSSNKPFLLVLVNLIFHLITSKEFMPVLKRSIVYNCNGITSHFRIGRFDMLSRRRIFSETKVKTDCPYFSHMQFTDNTKLCFRSVKSKWAFGAKITSYRLRCDVITSHRR